MQKLLVTSILLSSILISCSKGPEPEPEGIRTYCNLYHFIPGMESVIWEVNGEEITEESLYALLFPTRVFLEEATEEIVFAVKHAGTKQVLVSQMYQLEENKYYNVIVSGSAEDPSLFMQEVDTSRPASGRVKFQFMHAIPGRGPIDIFMGDTTLDKRVLTALAYQDLSDPLEVNDYDARASMTATAHGDSFDPDSVLVHAIYSDLVVSGANYLSVVAHFTWDTISRLTFWLYSLPLD